MKSGTCSTCSLGEVWPCAFGNAPDVASCPHNLHCEIFILADLS